MECYERLKGGLNGAPAAATNPLSVGIAYATLERSTADKLPLITINHGRTDSTDGSVFPYVFPLQLNPYSEVSAIVNWIAQQAGGEQGLKGKKIVTLFHGSPYGKETNGVLQALADKYGFELTLLEVPHPGNEQQSQWLNIRRLKPDWVILRGWGVMNPVALKTAQKVGFLPTASSAISGAIPRKTRRLPVPRPRASSPSPRIRQVPSSRCCRASNRRWWTRAKATWPIRSASAPFTTTSAWSTASSTSRHCVWLRRSSAGNR